MEDRKVSMKERMQGMKLNYQKEEKLPLDVSDSQILHLYKSKKEFSTLGQIGQGASATVEKCKHNETGRVVALKV